jgi:hypothetical protein
VDDGVEEEDDDVATRLQVSLLSVLTEFIVDVSLFCITWRSLVLDGCVIVVVVDDVSGNCGVDAGGSG